MEDDLLEFSYRMPEKPVEGEIPLYWQRPIGSPRRHIQMHRTKRHLTLEDLDLSVRASSCLEIAGVDTVQELMGYTAEELLEFRNFGETTLKEVKTRLAVHGLKLKDDY